MPQILGVEDVNKSFGKLMAVGGVSFEVEEGEIFGIAGPNGAGKTTLFNIVSNIPYRADSGRIIFQGKQIQTASPHVICHQGLARTFQRETVFETMSVLDNVWLGAAYGRPGNKKRQRVRERAMEALELVGLSEDPRVEASHLSHFNKKLLMLASALVTQPKLLLLDEPASGLNEAEIERTAETCRVINSRGITIILIEHVLPLLLALSHRMMILNEGRKLTEGLPEDLIKDENVIKAYLGGGYLNAA